MLGLRSRAERITNRAIINTALAHANLTNAWHGLTGTNSPEQRLGEPIWEQNASSTESIANLCIFVIYSPEATLSTISYLQALKDAGFEILAINNTNTSDRFLAKLKPLCWKIYNRRNIGRDIGAFKDGIMYLFAEGYMQRCHFLCMANDSMQFVPGHNGQDFTSRIARFINEGNGALFSHESHQIEKHYQSYFQILDNRIATSREFHGFWSRYRPLSHREHCIHRGELELSRSVYTHIKKITVLYSIDALLSAMRLAGSSHPVTVDEILGIMPSIARTKQNKKSIYALDQLSSAALEKKPMDSMSEHYLSELIESSNPSHVAAFLYPTFLRCPLIKHDICFAGSFSTGKALLLFNEILSQSGIEKVEREARSQEFRTLITMKGIPSDYRNKPVQKALKGVTSGFQYTPS